MADRGPLNIRGFEKNAARKAAREARRLSSPPRLLTVAEIAAMDANKPTTRINVTAADRQAQLQAQGALTFDQQKEEIRRLNSILLSLVGSEIAAGAVSDEQVNRLAKCSSIAKVWTTEERQSGAGEDPDRPLSPIEIAKALKK